MPWFSPRIGNVVKGTVIALVTWGVLYLAKEHLGRTAAFIVAGLILGVFIVALFGRAWLTAGRPRE